MQAFSTPKIAPGQSPAPLSSVPGRLLAAAASGLLVAAVLWSPPDCRAQNEVAADELALLDLWTAAMKDPADAAKVLPLCAEFERARSNNVLSAVTRGLASWCLLKNGRTSEGKSLLETMAAKSFGALREHGVALATGWLTRIDMDDVRGALRTYYRRNVGYPESLDELKKSPAGKKVPLSDRWGKPWLYGLSRMKTIRNTADQDYRLSSARLGADSDLAAALAAPYGEKMTVSPVEHNAGSVTLAREDGRKTTLAAGQADGNVCVAYVGTEIVVLTDGKYWAVFPLPK